LILGAGYLLLIGCAETQIRTATQEESVKQPDGWVVQYVDASCIVHTKVLSDKTPWSIKMGHIAGNQLILMFSASNDALRNSTIPEQTEAWFTVDGKDFPALGVTLQDGEIVLPVENGLQLQKALASATTVGVKIQARRSASRIQLAEFTLTNIGGAAQWLSTCNLIGAEAMPKLGI
jgi:hypothetical protein